MGRPITALGYYYMISEVVSMIIEHVLQREFTRKKQTNGVFVS